MDGIGITGRLTGPCSVRVRTDSHEREGQLRRTPRSFRNLEVLKRTYRVSKVSSEKTFQCTIQRWNGKIDFTTRFKKEVKDRIIYV